MSKSFELKTFLDRAKEQEKKYNWLAAAEFHEKALSLVLRSRDFLKAGEIQEQVGYCFYRAAFQAETNEDFKKRMRLAADAYNRGAERFERVEKRVGFDYCKALALWVNYWIAQSYAEKRDLLTECRGLWKKVTAACRDAEDWLRYGKVCNELLECLLEGFEIEQDWSSRREILTEGLDYGEKAIANLRELRDDYELTRAYYLTGLLYFWLDHYGELKKGKELGEKSFTYLEKALELSEKVRDGYLIAMSNLAAVHSFWIMEDLEISLKRAEKVLQQGLKMKDNLLIGQAFSWLAGVTYWTAETEEDPEKKRETYKKVLEYANQSTSHLDIISSYAFGGQTHWAYVESLALMAWEVETERKQKRVLLERAIKARRKAVERANRSGQPESIAYLAKSLSKALYFLSFLERKTSERKALLEEALKHAVKNLEIAEQAFPFWYWYRGVGQNYQALILAELASIESNDEKKKVLLEKAVLNMERCIEFCTKWTTEFQPYPPTGFFGALGRYYDGFGNILNQLYQLTGETKNLQKMIEVYRGAIETYTKADMPSRLAETHWQIARVKDELGEHTEAAENFQYASRKYKASADKIPHLKEFYRDYVLYMRAWSEIERARHNHEEENYNQSKEHYEKAASNLKLSRIHGYLSPYFAAWAKLEHAEDLSRKEKPRKSIATFQQASEKLGKAKESIGTEVNKIVSPDERQKATELGRACKARKDYCQGRIHLEEAKIHDRAGNHLLSAKKYGSANKAFQGVMKVVESELERRDLLQTAYLCQAWQKMMMAEAKVSPELYLEASTLFEKAKEQSVKERTSLLSLGNSYFCKALEAGTRFEATRDMNLYSAAKRHLDTAATYYTKAGFEKASTWVNATEALFDAYVYMSNAEVEVSHKKKTRLYGLARKHLERSAQLYEKARYIGKRDEVLRSLKNVEEKWEFTLSLDEVLTAPSITSSTTLISTPTTQEEAVGVERFEHADIQANLIMHVREVRVGDDLSLEIELVNAGKGPALLMRVEEIIPEGFKLKDKPEMYRVEDRYLNMKGKRLDPLKTEEVRLVLNPIAKGTFPLKPRILYLDETGKYKSHEPEPVTVIVKELGISGWLKGPSR